MIWLSRNIIYQMQIKPEPEDELVINSNELVSKRMEELQKELEKKAQEEAMKAMMDPQPVLDEEGNPLLDEEGNPIMQVPEFVPLDPPQEEPAVDYMAEAREEAEAILSQARLEADAIIQDAQNQAEEMRANAQKVGEQNGYQDGMAKANRECELKKAELADQEQLLMQKYQRKEEAMEHDLVDVISNVIEKVFMVQFADKKEIVLHLADNALSNIEGSKIFQIKVSEYNYEFLLNNKLDLQDRVGSDIQIDIVLDPLLDQSQCIIETDGGIFDCSLGVQLENLIKDLRSLS